MISPPIVPPVAPTRELNALLDQSHAQYARRSFLLARDFLGAAVERWKASEDVSKEVQVYFYLYDGLLLSAIAHTQPELERPAEVEKLALMSIMEAVDLAESIFPHTADTAIPRLALGCELYHKRDMQMAIRLFRQAEAIAKGSEGEESVITLLCSYNLCSCFILSVQLMQEYNSGALSAAQTDILGPSNSVYRMDPDSIRELRRLGERTLTDLARDEYLEGHAAFHRPGAGREERDGFRGSGENVGGMLDGANGADLAGTLGTLGASAASGISGASRASRASGNTGSAEDIDDADDAELVPMRPFRAADKPGAGRTQRAAPPDVPYQVVVDVPAQFGELDQNDLYSVEKELKRISASLERIVGKAHFYTEQCRRLMAICSSLQESLPPDAKQGFYAAVLDAFAAKYAKIERPEVKPKLLGTTEKILKGKQGKKGKKGTVKKGKKGKKGKK